MEKPKNEEFGETVLYWQREGSRRKGLVGGRQIAEDLALKLWAEFCRIRGNKSSQCFRRNCQGERRDHLTHKDR